MLKRTFEKLGESYDLLVAEPKRAESGEFWTTVSLTSGDDTIWSHEIGGVDGVQSTLCALSFARRLLEAKGGFTFLGGEDLMLPDF
ncbi:hypothetical protein [Bifidobacterium sp. ESL0790]|uniref:hypothetical protein n=1 Tax=Bifidobacterium sp. ESL0790 TaxID=2983233 RepID=UPI0023F8A9FE|nr:hypothetical protein [Bifidobacterium sp. ESL0790]WEV72009.1 hypothetical protein OZY47_06060 [Bifidobacterium sp. ESL0790]